MTTETDYAGMTDAKLSATCGDDANKWADALCHIAALIISGVRMVDWGRDAHQSVDECLSECVATLRGVSYDQ